MKKDKINVGTPDGPELVISEFTKRTILKNVTIEILENEITGDISYGWYRQNNTEEIQNLEERNDDNA